MSLAPRLVRSRRRPPAGGLVAIGAVSVQCGAALATQLFSRVGPAGAVTLRLVLAALVLSAVARPRLSQARKLVGRRRDVVVACTFGVVLAAMNLCFYEAIARVPLGVAVTVEFAGPLAVTIVGSRQRRDLLWALLAGTGVFLLAGGGLIGEATHLNLAGVGLALLTGCFWAAYILLSAQTGRRFGGTSGLAVAMIAAAVVTVPVGAAVAGTRLVAPGVLGLGAGVALLSSVIPYSLDLAALRRVTPRAFGILLSMDPGVAALAGLVVLGQRMATSEVVAMALVVAANAGSSWFDRNAPAASPLDARPE